MIKMTFPAVSWPWHRPISMVVSKIDFSCRLFVMVRITSFIQSGVASSKVAVAINHHPACPFSCISSPPPFRVACISSSFPSIYQVSPLFKRIPAFEPLPLYNPSSFTSFAYAPIPIIHHASQSCREEAHHWRQGPRWQGPSD